MTVDARDIDEAPPSPSAMIESMRAFGYSLPTAIADLIDNSITAGACRVWVHFEWNGRDSFVTISDDGSGMTEERLRDAMRLGSRSPLEQRDQNDLGRFSIGLKTASLSQCRRLTVASWVNGHDAAIRCWDLDYLSQPGVDGWNLLRRAASGSERRLEPAKKTRSGTVVLWELLDRVVGDAEVSDAAAQNRFLQAVRGVEEHLAMVFHRYIAGSSPALRIYLNTDDDANHVQPWDPFLEGHVATISTPEEVLSLPEGTVRVRGFVLPHKDRLDPQVHRTAAGSAGWNSQQGFYVYRNRRLLVPGSWLGLGSPRSWTKEEHYKLARIQMDIPNTMDAAWQIDVRKSTARPPNSIRNRLRGLADAVRKQAREIYAHRGSYGPRSRSEILTRLWQSATRQGLRCYRIDRRHPLVTTAMELDQDHCISNLLRLLEETVPVQQIWLDAAEQPEDHAAPFEQVADSDVRRAIEHTYEALVAHERLSPRAAKDYLMGMEAFRDHQAIITALDDRCD